MLGSHNPFPQNFRWFAGPLDNNMDKFAALWPDTLSNEPSLRDLDYEPDVTLPAIVAGVLNAHSGRRLSNKAAFRSIDTCRSGRINDYMLEKYVRKYLVRGREKSGYFARRQDIVDDIVQNLMGEMDVDQDGIVNLDDFMAWSATNKLETLVDDIYDERVMRAEEQAMGKQHGYAS